MSNLKKNKRKSHLNSSQPFKLNVKKHVLMTCFKLIEEEGKNKCIYCQDNVSKKKIIVLMYIIINNYF